MSEILDSDKTKTKKKNPVTRFFGAILDFFGEFGSLFG
jgi:hypothetical protein